MRASTLLALSHRANTSPRHCPGGSELISNFRQGVRRNGLVPTFSLNGIGKRCFDRRRPTVPRSSFNSALRAAITVNITYRAS